MFCPKCGKENLDTSKFCKACGKPLPNRARGRQALSRNYAIPPVSNLIGQVLDGKYRIESRLGAGGMGDVFRATRMLIGDSVAIKILHAHLAADPQAAERFRREAVTATKLRHRNIVAIYDVGISSVYNVPYILMEIAEGATLRQIINHSKILPLDFAVTVIAQVCAALDDAHRAGIVHRDIKPENIIANQTPTGWHVKVLDFGIAKLYNEANSSLTQDGSAMGTPQYMSPEQCMGEQLDGRSDIYSVGIVLYEMLCGTVPFKDSVASAIAVHQVRMPPPPPRAINPQLTPEVEAVILSALSKQREPRPQTAQIFSREFIQAATKIFKSASAPTIFTALVTENNSFPLSQSAVFSKPKPITEAQNSFDVKMPEDFLLPAIPKPELDIFLRDAKTDALPNENAADILMNNEMAEVSKLPDEKPEIVLEEELPGDLSQVFEDAEFILDEILIENKANELEASRSIIKPSEPL